MGLEQFDPASLKALLDKLKPQPISVDLPSPQQPTGIDPEELRQTLTRANMMGIASKAANSYVPGAYGVMHGMRPMQLNEGSSDLVQQQGLAPLHAQQAAVDLANKQAAVTNNYNTEKAHLSLESQKANNAPTIAEMKGMINAAMLQPRLQNARDVATTAATARTDAAKIGAQSRMDVVDKQLGGADLSPEAQERLADQRNTTGQSVRVPGRGLAATAQSTKIENLAAQKAAKNGLAPLASAGANYKADTGSLGKLTANTDQMNMFEGTAIKNLNVLKGALSKLSETGSPWLNKPMRSWDTNALGAPEMAAYNAARTIVTPEVAKVLQSAAGTGVLTDTSQKHVDTVLDPNATAAQQLAAIDVILQDFANRRSSAESTKQEIRGRIGGQSDKQIVKWQKNVNSGKRRPVYSDGSYGPEQ
jgi:hypothetical protein